MKKDTPKTGVVLYCGQKKTPKGYIHCNGQLLDKYEYPRLYKLLDHSYGGYGDKFAVPDLRRLEIPGKGRWIIKD